MLALTNESLMMIAGGLLLLVSLLALVYSRQSRKLSKQWQQLEQAQQNLSSLNAVNIGLGHRIKLIEAKQGGGMAVQLAEQTPAGPAKFELGRDLENLQEKQQGLMASLQALEQAEPQNDEKVADFGLALASVQPELAPATVDTVDDQDRSWQVPSPVTSPGEPEQDMAQTPYTLASNLLDQGLSVAEVERQSGLSRAEVQLMATMHKNMNQFAAL